MLGLRSERKMKRSTLPWVVVIGLLAAAWPLAAQNTQEPAQKPAPPRIYQLVVFKLGPAWQKDKTISQQPGIQEHAAYMSKLLKEEILVLGGPLLDEKATAFAGAMMVLAADTPEDAKRILGEDPAHKSGLLQIEKINPMIITGASWNPAGR